MGMVSSVKLVVDKYASPAAKVTRIKRVGRENGLRLNFINSGKAGRKFPARCGYSASKTRLDSQL
jgi:hypothetical protein